MCASNTVCHTRPTTTRRAGRFPVLCVCRYCHGSPATHHYTYRTPAMKAPAFHFACDKLVAALRAEPAYRVIQLTIEPLGCP